MTAVVTAAGTAAISKRARVHVILSGRGEDRLSRWVTFGLVVLILANAVAVIVGTVPAIEARWGAALEAFELFSVTLFALEYGLRVWSCREAAPFARPLRGRLRFMLTPMALIDLVAFLPALLPWLGLDMRYVRILRLARLLRLAKLGRYSEAMQRLMLAIQLKREELVLSVVLMLLMLIIASSLMYAVEHDAQPAGFSSIPGTMWWGIMTLTTVGYGDVYPITALGKFFAALIAVMGVGLFAMPVGIIGSAFISMDTAKAMAEASSAPASSPIPTACTCPHCGKSIAPPGG